MKTLAESRIREAFRLLMLPVILENEEKAIDAFTIVLSDKGIDPAEQPIWVSYQLQLWEDSGSASSELRSVVLAVIDTIYPGERFNKYFDLYESLRSAPHFLQHQATRQFLFNLPLMVKLSREERMSGAQIARVLSALDERIRFDWKSVKSTLEKVGAYKSLGIVDFQGLYEADSLLEEAVFADAGISACIDLIEILGKQLGFPAGLGTNLRTICIPNGNPLYSILEILHYQLSLIEFYDHALSYAYEFSPRGALANWLHDQYPQSLKTGAQPFLNIAKGAFRLDRGWALARETPDALALVNILMGMEQLGFASRKEIASNMRWLLHRLIKKYQPLDTEISELQTQEEVTKLLNALAERETNTRGILEQRIIDAVSASIYRDEDGWKSKGLGDSVNATNLSGRKLGDCEYLNATSRELVAIEVHGGRLTPIYVLAHLETMKKNLPAREEELSRIDDLKNWKIKIVFVAHEIRPHELQPVAHFPNIDIGLEYFTFKDLIGRLPSLRPTVADMNRWVINPLNNKASTLTPKVVRDVAVKILS